MKDVITEQFVDELVKSDIWAKVDKANPISENRTATYLPAPTRAATESEEEDTTLSEEPTAEDFAVELLENLAPEVILEFLDIIHEKLLNEQAENGDSEQIDEGMASLAGGIGGTVGAFKGAGDTYKIRRDIARRGQQKRAEEIGASRESRKGVKHKYGAGIDSKVKRILSLGHAGQGIKGYTKQTRAMGAGGASRVRALRPTKLGWTSGAKKKAAAKGSGTDVEAATAGSTGQRQAAGDLAPKEFAAKEVKSRSGTHRTPPITRQQAGVDRPRSVSSDHTEYEGPSLREKNLLLIRVLKRRMR